MIRLLTMTGFLLVSSFGFGMLDAPNAMTGNSEGAKTIDGCYALVGDIHEMRTVEKVPCTGGRNDVELSTFDLLK